MKKLLLLFCFALIMGQSYAQNWKRVGTGLPFHFANAYNEAIEFGGEMHVVGYAYNGVDTYTPGVYVLSSGIWSQVGSGFTTTPTAALFNINAIVEFGGELFIGGNFAMNNGTDPEFYDVAKWDTANSRWVAVGDGTCDGVVNELTVYNNKLYAGGNFDDLGAAGTNNIAVYDGTSWGAVGLGTSIDVNGSEDDDQVKAMIVYNSKLYVGGKFSQAGGELVHNLAHWDGTNWGYFNGDNINGYGGVGGNLNGEVDVLSLEVFGTDLYVGGKFGFYYNFSFIGGSTSVPNNLAVWDGSFFSAPTKATPSNTSINAMTVFDSRLYIGNSNQNNIYSWNGSSIFNWELEPDRDPIRQRVNGFYNNGTDIYYVQNYGVYQLADPLASFYASSTNTCADTQIIFTDNSSSTNTITAWSWTFEGGTPATSIDQNPVVSFVAGGPYDVTLEVTSSDGSDSYTYVDYITIADDVSVILDPTPSTICSSANAVFTTNGSGTNGVTYQWQINNGSGYVDLFDVTGEIIGSTSAQLTFVTPSVDLDGNNVKCVITNACGSNSIATAEALLTVTAAPIITEESFDQAVCEDGGDVDFTIVSTGTTTYQWTYYNGTAFVNLSDTGPYSGTTTATLSVTNANNTTILSELYDADFSDGITDARYRCVLTANGCTTNTLSYRLTIYASPSVTENPVDVTQCDSGTGVSASFSVASSPNIPGLTYQWQVNDGSGFSDVTEDALYSGATTKTLSLTAANSDLSGYLYKCLIGNCSSPTESASALLTINNLPGFVLNTVDTQVCDGGNATFSIEATGDNLTYQWQERRGSGSYVDIVDDAMYSQFGNTLDITGATLAMDNYRYRCVVSSGDGCERIFGGSRLFVYRKQTLTNNTSTPTDLIVCDGGNATLRVSTSAGYNAGFHVLQWQVDFAGNGVFTDLSDDDERYSGVNTRYLEITGVNVTMNENQYKCVVTNCDGSTASDPEILTVLQLALVIEHPQSQTICRGDQVTFTALATGSDLEYSWWRDTGNGFQQVRSARIDPDYTFTVSTVDGFNGNKFKCIAQAGNCTTSTAESFEAILTVQENRILDRSPSPSQICAGETIKFGVMMSNLDGLTFQWSDDNGVLTDGDMYSGVTTDTLTITAPITAINNYSVAITGDCGNTAASFNLGVAGLGTPEIEAQFGDPSNPAIFVTNTGIFQLGVDNFEWFLNGSSYQNTGNAASVTIDQVGSYTVVATKGNCAHPESNAVIVVITGFENNLAKSAVSIYPNPVNNKLTLEMGNDFDISKGSKIILTNTSGKQVFIKRYNDLYNRKVDIDMTGFESGIYIVSVINGDSIVQYKITKQ